MPVVDLNGALAAALLSMLTNLSLAIYSTVIPLAGGRDAPLWRWLLVEQGLFALFLFVAVWFTRLVLGLRRTANWGAAAVVAVVFGLLWNWYGLTAAHAIEVGLHPYAGWELTFFTWGLPLLAAGLVFPTAGLMNQLGVGMAEVAGAVLFCARMWAVAPNPFTRVRASAAKARRPQRAKKAS
jgi:hypothetical protein